MTKIKNGRRREDQLINITHLDNDFVPLLYQAGYLTIKDYDPNSKEYVLGFPNNEVKEAFWNSLADHFFSTKTRTLTDDWIIETVTHK